MRPSDRLFESEPRLARLERAARVARTNGYPTLPWIERQARRLVGPDRVPDGPPEAPLGPDDVAGGGTPPGLVRLAVYAGLLDPLSPAALARSRLLSSETSLVVVLARLRRARLGRPAAA